MIPSLTNVTVTLMDNTHIHGLYGDFQRGHHEVLSDDMTVIRIPFHAVKFIESFEGFDGPDDDFGGDDDDPDPDPKPAGAFLLFRRVV